METMFRRFLWHDEVEHHKYHLVDWNTCCKPISLGDLGLGGLEFITRFSWPNGCGNSGWNMIVYDVGWWCPGLGRNRYGNLGR